MQATQAVKIKFELDKKSSLFRNRFFFEFEIEKKSSDTRYFKNQVEIDRGYDYDYIAMKRKTRYKVGSLLDFRKRQMTAQLS